MYTPPCQADILGIYETYTSGKLFEQEYEADSFDWLEIRTFLGSKKSLCIKAREYIQIENPGCIAAPSINFIANEILNWGVSSIESKSTATRLYAIQDFNLKANRISVGDFTILHEPENGSIECKNLTLLHTESEEPLSFEIIKSWVKNDNTEIITSKL
jgi:hypothetical protein